MHTADIERFLEKGEAYVTQFFVSTGSIFLIPYVLAIVAGVLLLYTTLGVPLVDYDEATYADVITETLATGDPTTLTFQGEPWLVKPPLYFWVTMPLVIVLGAEDYVFRLPSILAALVCLVLVYHIVLLRTGSVLLGALGFLMLFTTPPFFAFAREARLDSSVIATLLIVYWCFLKGRKDPRYWIGIAPAIAIGFLFKSVIALLILPLLLVYILVWRESRIFFSRSTWRGVYIAVAILAPWHILETIRFGSAFWYDYVWIHVVERTARTYTGSSGVFDYVAIIWQYYWPWLPVVACAVLAVIAAQCVPRMRHYVSRREAVVLFAYSGFLFILFTAIQTHLSTYILPIFPFMTIGSMLAIVPATRAKYGRFAVVCCGSVFIAIGLVFSFSAARELNTPYTQEEKRLGQVLHAAQVTQGSATVYALDWPVHEVINYYGSTYLQYLDPRTIGGKEVAGPFYLVTTVYVLPLLSQQSPTFEVLFRGRLLVLLRYPNGHTFPQLVSP